MKSIHDWRVDDIPFGWVVCFGFTDLEWGTPTKYTLWQYCQRLGYVDYPEEGFVSYRLQFPAIINSGFLDEKLFDVV